MIMDTLYLEPLQGGIPKTKYTKSKRTLSGPKKLCRLCILGILLPSLLISVPIYLRYRVYDYTLYPVGMSDMRMIDNKVSTTWCQRQIISANTSFMAFLMPRIPNVAHDYQNVKMKRQIVLSDDMKEYWGFYLLKGSIATISTCTRWPGASLIVIRGHKNLHECAYIGDNSSEELEEILENLSESSNAPSNHPDMLRRHNGEIIFHDTNTNATASRYEKNMNNKNKNLEDEISAKEMRIILEQLIAKSKQFKNIAKLVKHNETSSKNFSSKYANNITNHIESTLNTSNISLNVSSKNIIESDEILHELQQKIAELSSRNRNRLFNKYHNGTKEETKRTKDKNPTKPRTKRQIEIHKKLKNILNIDDEDENLALEEGFTPDGHADHHQILNQTTNMDMSNSEFWSSFSSSEEALLNCSGLILSLPLTPDKRCLKKDGNFEKASLINSFTYTIPTNGYYFFIFNSDNEVQENYVEVEFSLKKAVYNITNPLSICKNTNGPCSFPLNFFSNEKVILEMPIEDNEALWNKDYIVQSECEPRTSIYLICVISVPILIIVFALQ